MKPVHFLVPFLLALVFVLSPPDIATVQAGPAETQQGRLWQIDRPGLEPSYLFGTMHSEHPEITRLPQHIRSAFEQADKLVMEMVMNEAAMRAMLQAGLFGSGRDLRDVLDASLYERTIEAMQDYGVPESISRRYKPWMVFSTLMMPPAETGLFLDMKLFIEARQGGMPVAGLETAAEQIEVFDGMSMDDQIALLEDALDHRGKLDAYFADMRSIYLSGDLSELERFSEEMMEDADPALVERFTRRFMIDRNHLMAERMQPHLAAGNAFIAVGALHLPGEEGILNLLAEQGYRVRAVAE